MKNVTGAIAEQLRAHDPRLRGSSDQNVIRFGLTSNPEAMFMVLLQHIDLMHEKMMQLESIAGMMAGKDVR